ncbi:MAG: carbamoyltransferase HypF [Actinomycetota bacterium]|nr:carbamoyltransferase HypF [Actinomycetota bacterium]
MGRVRIHVDGIVQGVGFRPFVYTLARELSVSGFVRNTAAGVVIEAEAQPQTLAAFADAIRSRSPALARIDDLRCEPIAATGVRGFEIELSTADGPRRTLISPDTATCPDCLAEMADPADRRYRYPFTNCTNCGPRFTIVTGVPYDRAATTMAGFAMCPDCQREYDDPADRRFHAQPVCCPACGPRLRLVDAARRDVPGDPIDATADLLRSGSVVAVKGLGGYHLAVDARSDEAVANLRSRKHREDKPFAVLMPDLGAVRTWCEVSPAAAELLAGHRRPIVVLPRRQDVQLAPALAPGNDHVGVLLPYTPLHHLLAQAVGAPIVLTSGNVSDEPIAYLDDEAATRLAGLADAFLTHDRPIRMRTDDSVFRVARGRPQPVRRSRGYAPEPITLPLDCPRPVLAVGAELKNTICLARGRQAFVSHHIGDLENYETMLSFLDGIAHFGMLFDLVPEVVAHDLHPEYLSTKYAVDLPGVEVVGVQHHHAHIAACLADNGELGPVIGVAYDGTGFGSDGTLWGGEILLADLSGFCRLAHLEPVPLPGGAAAIRAPWRMAASYLQAAYGEELPPGLDVARRNQALWDPVLAMAARGVNAPLTSSAGRLFDAVSALIGIRDQVNFEGQAAIELEQSVDRSETGSYPMRVRDGLLMGSDLVRAVIYDLGRSVPVPIIAARFHRGLATGTVQAAATAAQDTAMDTVALSGGVFQNAVLLDLVVDGLERAGLRVLTHKQIPCNDGGISLGQTAVAAALSSAAAGLR